MRVVAKGVDADEARRLGMMDMAIETYQWHRDFGFYGGESISPVVRQLHPQMKDFQTFLRSNTEWRQLFA